MREKRKINELFKDKLKTSASPELDSRIDSLIARADEKQTQTSHTWRLLMKNRMTKLAVAAVLIISTFVGINHFGGSIDMADVAFAEVEEAVNQMPLMHKLLDTKRDGQQYDTEKWYRFDSKSVLAKYSKNGECYKISSLNYNTMENVVYDPASDIVKVSYRVDVGTEHLPPSPWIVFEDYLKNYERWGALVTREKKKFEGENVDVYYLTIPSNSRKERVEAEFFVNRNNNLPILFKGKSWTPEGQLISDGVVRFDFPESGPMDIYDLGVSRTTKVIHDLESKQRLARKKELRKDELFYEKQFKEVYRLEESEVLKHIPPSLTEPRIKLNETRTAVRILTREGSTIMPSFSSDEIERMNKENNYYEMFPWDGEMFAKGGRHGFRDGVTLKDFFERIIVLPQFQYVIPDTLSSIKIPGDWVVRKGTAKEQLLKAFERVLQDCTNRPIRFEKRQVERDVIVARGEFHFKPLSGTYDDNWIHVYSDTLDSDERGGGGTYSLDSFLTQRLGETQLKQHVVNLTELSGDVRIKCGCHESGYIGKILDGAERDAKLDLLLDNLSSQTSLVFTKERLKVDIWDVVESDQN